MTEQKPNPQPSEEPAEVRSKEDASVRSTLSFEEPQAQGDPPVRDSSAAGVVPTTTKENRRDELASTLPFYEQRKDVDEPNDIKAKLEEDCEDIEVLTRQYLDNLLAKHRTPEPVSPPKPPAPSEPKRTYSGPTPPPERTVDFKGMRELVNANVRKRIQVADRGRFRSAFLMFLLAAGSALVCIILAIIADSMLSVVYLTSVAFLLFSFVLTCRFYGRAIAIERDNVP